MKRFFGWVRAHKRLTVVIAVVLIGGFLFIRSRNGNGQLEAAVVERGDVEEELVLTGEIKATEHAILQFNTSGTISWVGVGLGENVSKGQALVKLDTTRLNSAYQIARANYRAAEANAEQVLDSLKDKDNNETFEERNTRTAAETARDKAWDALVAARKDLAEATLIAPFSGVVALLNSESPGVNITAGTPQVVIVNPETIYFEVSADQTEVSLFKLGDAAEIVLDAFDSETLSATVAAISVAPDTTETGTVYPIRLLPVLSDSNKYKIAMTGDARFILSKKEDVLYVPSSFVNSDREGSYVLVNGGRERKYVEVGLEGEERIEIISGIEEGEQVFD